ncbi:hypothetical protein LCGC14_2929380 [marine sediment metagenome]|uniref:Uncharacterized protein n=1 Tax=marine sediment metagenome TaxID=412755 RepID=A0A0F8ZU16_9ZZZZ
MQEVRHDGSEALTEGATMEDFDRAMKDERNASVALHKPGAVFKSKGRTLQVMNEGRLKELRRQKRKSQKAARKRNRGR